MTDNGPCFLSKRFASYVADQFEHVPIRFRTPEQLGLLKRFHGTLKREEVHWNEYETPTHARTCLATCGNRYNSIRPHWALRPTPTTDPLTPHDVYIGGRRVTIPAWQGWARASLRKLIEAGLIDPETEEVLAYEAQ